MLLAAAFAALLLAGCDDMTDQRKDNPYRVSRGDPAPLPFGAVPFGDKRTPPPPVTLALLQRGQSRFRAFCTPCHSELGDGHGMVVQRGFSPPPDYNSEALRQAPTEHFFDVITNGHGAMYSFAQRVPPNDRWAIAAYIRALQRSESATVAELSGPERAALDAGRPGPDSEFGAGSAPWAAPGLGAP